jgi:hypothetical protein
LTKEQAINLATGTFDQLCLVEMTLDWLICVPDPVANLNSVIQAWRAQRTAQYDAQARANFERDGTISTDRDFLLSILDEA